jgi:hypothetical protein
MLLSSIDILRSHNGYSDTKYEAIIPNEITIVLLVSTTLLILIILLFQTLISFLLLPVIYGDPLFHKSIGCQKKSENRWLFLLEVLPSSGSPKQVSVNMPYCAQPLPHGR